jgi:NTP pyrophosphatase (non-canonical NTP hydrolase)
MGYMTDGLTFNNLREANKARLPQFKNSKGEPAHEKKDGSDWSLAEWMNAVAGELGEAANVIKKIRRGDMTLEEAKEMLAEEFADIVTYLDITAMQAGINLGKATMDKFNKVSKRVGSSIRLDAYGVHEINYPK